jgi:hypothetical protein
MRHFSTEVGLCYYRRNIMLSFRTYRVTRPGSSTDKNRRTTMWTRPTDSIFRSPHVTQIKWQLFGIASPRAAFFSVSPYKFILRNSNHRLDLCQQNGSTCFFISFPFRYSLGETWGDQLTATPLPGYQLATSRLEVRHSARRLHIYLLS